MNFEFYSLNNAQWLHYYYFHTFYFVLHTLVSIFMSSQATKLFLLTNLCT